MAEKKNAIAHYFENFGLKQICDIMMILGAVLLIVGLFVSIASVVASEIILGIGLGIYIIACILALVSTVKVLLSKINRRSPEYKRAITNTVIMGVILALAIFGFVFLLVA